MQTAKPEDFKPKVSFSNKAGLGDFIYMVVRQRSAGMNLIGIFTSPLVAVRVATEYTEKNVKVIKWPLEYAAPTGEGFLPEEWFVQDTLEELRVLEHARIENEAAERYRMIQERFGGTQQVFSEQTTLSDIWQSVTRYFRS